MLQTSDLKTFQELLRQSREGPCQAFLTTHQRLLLDTFGRHLCLPKFRFGAEFESDFVLISVSSSGISATLVELEPPRTKPFNLDGTYSRRLNQALNQIHDWLAWIERHEDYLRERVVAKAGEQGRDLRMDLGYGFRRQAMHLDAKIVIGRREHLTDETNEKRLSVFSTTSRRIEITNYDRLLEVGAQICASWVRDVESKQQLGRLARNPFSRIRRAVARSSKVSPTTLDHLAEDAVIEVKRAVAANASTDSSTLRRLADSPDPVVRREVAQNPRTSREDLEFLYSSGEREVQEGVLRNENCALSILEMASQDSNPALRLLVAKHPLTTKETQHRLAQDRDDGVRRVLAGNKHVDLKVALELLADPDNLVRFGIYKRNDVSEELIASRIEEEPSWLRATIAQNPSLKSAKILSTLASDSAVRVRVAAASNPNIPEPVLRSLLRDKDERVRNAASAALERQGSEAS